MRQHGGDKRVFFENELACQKPITYTADGIDIGSRVNLLA
jgi:hypothetical protein